MQDSAVLATRECPYCAVCGSEGKMLYDGLEDVLFGVTGRWDVKRCTNEACGLHWLDPMPRAEELYKAYRGYPTHQDMAVKTGVVSRVLQRAFAGYRARRFGYNIASVTNIDRVLGTLAGMLAPLRLQMEFPFIYFRGAVMAKLLEIGCGGGESLKMFDRWGWTTEGLDFDEAAVANARAKGLMVHHGDLLSRNYAACSFDAIYSCHVIEHVPHPKELLQECHRLLRLGGRCVMLTPNADSIGHRWFGSSWRGLEPPRHLHIFTHNSLTDLARSAGFTSFQITTSSRLSAAMYVQSALTRRHGGPGARAPLDIKLGAMLVHFVAYVFWRLSRRSGEELIFMGYKPE